MNLTPVGRSLQLCVLVLCLEAMPRAETSAPINVLSFNVRFDNARDGLNGWNNRRDRVVSQILFHEADVVGFQEPLFRQVKDLEDRLPAFRYVGVGSDDGVRAGTHAAIFFRGSRFAPGDSGTFWLSETPNIPGSKDWDSAHPRIVTWVRLADRNSGHVLFVFNTHFDHRGVDARRRSARLLLEAVWRISGEHRAIVTGDFNADPESEPIQILTGSTGGPGLIDSRSVSETGHYGPTGTFNGFEAKEKSDLPIDYIFIKGEWRALQHATLSQTWGGRFASDHFAVFARLVFR